MRTVSVNCSPGASADFRTVNGALQAIAAAEAESNGAAAEWTVRVAPGIYRELVRCECRAKVAVIGQGSAPFGRDVVIQYANCERENKGTKNRAVFYFSGAGLRLENLTVINSSERDFPGCDAGGSQAEALNFDGGAGAALTARNCAFLSHQDTIRTTGVSYLYRCRIEGDVDFIWGTADVCLVEDCELVCLNDPKRAVKESYLLVSRTGSLDAEAIPKGYVVLNSRITVEDGITLFLGRNAGNSGFYDQCAVINTDVRPEGSARLDPAVWKESPYVFLSGAQEHAGWKIFGITVNGRPLDAAMRLSHTALIPPALFAAEYANRQAILSRVYCKDGVYRNAAQSIHF